MFVSMRSDCVDNQPGAEYLDEMDDLTEDAQTMKTCDPNMNVEKSTIKIFQE